MKATGFLFLSLMLTLFSDVIPEEVPQVDCGDFPSLICPLNFDPHCGSDGHTYDNKCLFCNAVIKNKGKLGLKSLGLCPET